MRCLVTGATGFVGSHLVDFLLRQGWEVGVLVRSGSNTWRIKEILDRLQVIRGDLSDTTRFERSLYQFAPEVVFHLAWGGVRKPSRNDLTHVNQNLYNSLDLLRALRKCGCRCWVSLGSQAEYGHYEQILTEDSPTRPTTIYGTTKLWAGRLSQKLCQAFDIRFVWLRLFATYGPMDDSHSLIPYVINSLLQHSIPNLTRGEQRWDYLFVEDAAKAMWQAADSPTVSGVFNLGAGSSSPVREIVERIQGLIDPRIHSNFGAVPYQSNQIMFLQSDITRLRNATGWTPQVSLDEGLERTVKWYREYLPEHRPQALSAGETRAYESL